MKRAILIAVVIAVGLAYLAGFWPQHRQLSDVRAQLQETQARLAAAEARIRLGEMLGRLLALSDAVGAKNYGQAATLSSSFFDAVRTEATRAPLPAVTSTLQEILNARDRVTTAIAGTDPALTGILKEEERSLRRVLGYPVDGS
jgi:hypothetical protein